MSAISTPPPPRNAAAFLDGLKAASRSIFMFVLFGSYISIGALAHDLGFSMIWTMLTTVAVWAAPAQVILISSLGAGATPVEAAVAVGLSGMRLLPMVVALLPVLRAPHTRIRELLLPAHFTAVSFWIEALRLAPTVPRQDRITYANGLAIGLIAAAVTATMAGFYFAAVLPAYVVAALLFLTPMAFLTSAWRNSRLVADRAAFLIGAVMAPLLAYEHVGLDLLWTGLIGGTVAYGLHRLRDILR